MIQDWLSVSWSFFGDKWVFFGLFLFIYFYGGWLFFKGLVEEMKKLKFGMMIFIVVVIFVVYLYSFVVVFGLVGKIFFWELVMLIDVMLLGYWLEMCFVLGVSKVLEVLVVFMFDEAIVVYDDYIMKVKVSELKVGDVILIKFGEKVFVDGVIIEGESEFNESMFIGESKFVSKGIDDEVIGGVVNGNGVIKVEVNNMGDESYLLKVIGMVCDVQGQKLQM